VTRLTVLKSEVKCAVCSSGRRGQADALIARLGQTDEDGKVLRWADLLPLLAVILDRPSISTSAAKAHRRLHCRAIVSDPAVESDEDDTDEVMQAIIEELDELTRAASVSPTALLGIQNRLYLIQLKKRLERNEDVPISHDQAGRSADKLLTHEKERATGALLGILGQAISSVFERELGPASSEAKQIEGAEVVVIGEAVEITDGDEEAAS
jgi:hypothetical protein